VRALREQLPDLSAIGSLEALFSHSIQIVPSKTLDNTRGRPNNKRVDNWERGFAGRQEAFAVNP
jgi:hypothetical protein